MSITRADNALRIRRLELLRYRDFRHMIAAQFASQVSDAAATFILAGLVLFLTPDGPATAQLATMVSTSALPLVLAGPLSGFAADRFSRRAILFHGQQLRVLLALGLLIGALVGLDAMLFAIWAVSLCVAKVLYTARYASIRHLVRHHELVAADSTSLTAGTVAGVAGAVLGAGLLWSIGSFGFAVVAFGHFASATVIRRIAGPTGGGREHTMARWSELIDHLRAPKLRYAMVTTGALRLHLGVVLACIVSLGSADGSHSASGFATIMAASGLGTFIGTNTAEWVNENFNRRMTVLMAYLGSACALLITVALTSSVVLLSGFAMCSFFFQNLRLCSDATIQSNSLAGAGGREFAFYDINHNLLYLLGILIGLLAFAEVDRRLILGVCSATIVLCGVISLLLSRGEVLQSFDEFHETEGLPFVASGNEDARLQADRASHTTRLRSNSIAVRAPS